MPEFEVATIKPVDPNVPHMVGVEVYPGGRIVLSSLTLKALIAAAFRLSYWQIYGGVANIGYADGRWVIRAAEMQQLAKFASNNILHIPVLDRTELSGSFDYKQLQPDAEPNYRDNSDSFLRLIPELGLKLVRATGPGGVRNRPCGKTIAQLTSLN